MHLATALSRVSSALASMLVPTRSCRLRRRHAAKQCWPELKAMLETLVTRAKEKWR